MDTSEPTSAPTQEQGQATETGNVNDCKSTKIGDTRVALTLTQRKGMKWPNRKTPHRIAPPLWADAMEKYVSGQLGSCQAVSKFLGISVSQVTQRAAREHWNAARNRRAEQMRALIGQVPVRQLDREAEIADQLSNAQGLLAKRLLEHGNALADSLSDSLRDLLHARSVLVTLAPVDAGLDAASRRLVRMSRVHSEALNNLRILAGLASPDMAQMPAQAQGRTKHPQGKAQGSASTASPRGRSKAGPLGADPDAMRTVQGQGEEEGGGGMATVPPGGTGTPHSDPGLHSYGGPTSQSESSSVPGRHGAAPGHADGSVQGTVLGGSGAAPAVTAPRPWSGPVPPVPVQAS